MVAPLLIGAGIGALAGLLKSEFVDKPREERDRELAVATQRLSPFTGLKANKIREADPAASALQFGLAGASMGQQSAQLGQNQQLLDMHQQKLDQNALAEQVGGSAVQNPRGLLAAPQAPQIPQRDTREDEFFAKLWSGSNGF